MPIWAASNESEMQAGLAGGKDVRECLARVSALPHCLVEAALRGHHASLERLSVTGTVVSLRFFIQALGFAERSGRK